MIRATFVHALCFPRCEMRACPPYEMEHLSEEFTNGSSADATGNGRRFQAENPRQITIYQLMKPLKITPPRPRPPPPGPPTTILLCPLSSTQHYLHKHWLRSEERIWHDSHSSLFMLIFFNKTMAKKQDIFRRCLPLIRDNTHSWNRIQTRRGVKSFFVSLIKAQKRE